MAARPIDIYYYVIWTDNGSMLPEADTLRQAGKYPMIKVSRGCISKLVLFLFRTGNMQSAVFLSFVAPFSSPPCGLQPTHPPMPCYISPCVVYNIYGIHLTLFFFLFSLITSLKLLDISYKIVSRFTFH